MIAAKPIGTQTVVQVTRPFDVVTVDGKAAIRWLVVVGSRSHPALRHELSVTHTWATGGGTADVAVHEGGDCIAANHQRDCWHLRAALKAVELEVAREYLREARRTAATKGRPRLVDGPLAEVDRLTAELAALHCTLGVGR